MSARPRTRRCAGLAAAALCASLLAGCGDGPDDDAAGAPPSAGASTSTSASAPSASPSASAEASTPAPGEPGAEPVTPAQARDAAAAAFPDDQGVTFALDNGLALLSGEGVLDLRQDPTAVSASLASTETGDAQQVDVRVVDDVLYVADGVRWLRLEVDSPANPFGRSLTDQLDARRVLASVVEHLDSASRTGTTLALEADGPAVAEDLAPDLAGQEGVVVPSVVTADLEVDDAGRAAALTVDLGAENGQLAYTFTGWASSGDTAVTAPPPADVDELPALP